MSGKEIVTIQCGSFSNWVSTHLWNVHESFCYSNSGFSSKGTFDYDILFQRGENLKGDITFTPRLLLVDSPPYSVPFSPQSLYHGDSNPASNKQMLNWDGDVEFVDQRGDAPPQNEFMSALESEESESTSAEISFREQKFDIENSVSHWSEFAKQILHPKSFIKLSDYREGFLNSASENHMTPGSPSGLECFSSHLDVVEDSLHYMLEKCDNVQGFQVMTDVLDGVFSGFSSSMLELLRDENCKKSILTFACCEQPNDSNLKMFVNNKSSHIINSVSAVSALLSYSSAVIPLSFHSQWTPTSLQPRASILNEFNLKPNTFCYSALAAASLFSFAAPTFSTGPNFTPFSQYCDLLAFNGRKLCTGSFSVDSTHKDFVEFSPVDDLCQNSGDRIEESKTVSLCGKHSLEEKASLVRRLGTGSFCLSNVSHVEATLLLEPPFPTHLFNVNQQPPTQSVLNACGLLTNGVRAKMALDALVDDRTLRASQIASVLAKLNVDVDFWRESVDIVKTHAEKYL